MSFLIGSALQVAKQATPSPLLMQTDPADAAEGGEVHSLPGNPILTVKYVLFWETVILHKRQPDPYSYFISK